LLLQGRAGKVLADVRFWVGLGKQVGWEVWGGSRLGRHDIFCVGVLYDSYSRPGRRFCSGGWWAEASTDRGLARVRCAGRIYIFQVVATRPCDTRCLCSFSCGPWHTSCVSSCLFAVSCSKTASLMGLRCVECCQMLLCRQQPQPSAVAQRSQSTSCSAGFAKVLWRCCDGKHTALGLL
jgi:hypothetical protein